MIQIFNGRSRSLGQDAQDAVYLQVSVTLRHHLHHVKGARLGVLMAIALHSNAEGWAWPSMALLRAETGYNVQTISLALRDLCALTIDGHRVLLSVQDRAAHGTFATNRYLLFPSAEEVARFAREEQDAQPRPSAPTMATPKAVRPASKLPHVAAPSTAAPSAGFPSTENPYERSTTGNKNHDRERDPMSERAPAAAAPEAVEASADSPPSTDHPAVQVYRTTFGQSPTNCQCAAIAGTVTDLQRWRRVLDDWLTNAWRMESVGKMLDRYQHHHEEPDAAHTHRRANRPGDRHGHRPSAAPTPEELARFLNRPCPQHQGAAA